MKKLPEESNRFGTKLQQVKRSEQYAIYSLHNTATNKVHGYEVFQIQTEDGEEQFAQADQFGLSSGQTAWYFAILEGTQKEALERAMEKFAELHPVPVEEEVELLK